MGIWCDSLWAIVSCIDWNQSNQMVCIGIQLNTHGMRDKQKHKFHWKRSFLYHIYTFLYIDTRRDEYLALCLPVGVHMFGEIYSLRPNWCKKGVLFLLLLQRMHSQNSETIYSNIIWQYCCHAFEIPRECERDRERGDNFSRWYINFEASAKLWATRETKWIVYSIIHIYLSLSSGIIQRMLAAFYGATFMTFFFIQTENVYRADRTSYIECLHSQQRPHKK